MSGSICDRSPEPGRRRCHAHGGAIGSGAPSGRSNGRFLDGHHTKEAKAERRLVQQVLAGHKKGGHMGTTSRAAIDNGPHAEMAAKEQNEPRVSVEVYHAGGAGNFVARAPEGQDKKEWSTRLGAALGSRSRPFIEASLNRLLVACCPPRQDIPSSISVSAALAIIESLEPKNEIEAALAVEVACLQAACGNLLARLLWAHQDRPMTAAANAVAKLERALHSAIRTYMLLKHGNTQVIRIERLEIQGGAQAVVGQFVRP